MAATIATIWSTLVTALQAVDGTGDYTHDLSGAGQVARVRVSQPMLDGAFATVVLDDVPSDHDVVLGKYRRDPQFTVVGWGVATADTDQARSEAAVNMLDDILRAVEADRTLGGVVYDVLAHGRAFIAHDGEAGAQYPVAVVRVETYLRVDTGA